MDGLLKSVGNSITGLVAGAFDAMGAAVRAVLRAVFHAAEAAPPGGLLFVVVLICVAVGGWLLLKR